MIGVLWIYGSSEFCSKISAWLADQGFLPKACILETPQPKGLKPLPWDAVPCLVRPLSFWKILGFKSDVISVLKKYPELPVLFLAETKNMKWKPLSLKELKQRKLIQISPEPRWLFGFHLAWSDSDVFLPTWELAQHWLNRKVIWP